MLNLAEIYSNYCDSLADDKQRDPFRLFISDIGKCPRQIAYRLLETEKNYEPPQSKWNKSIMFSVALFLEDNLQKALEHAGRLIAFQDDIEMPDRDNWGGRLDFIADVGGRRVVEFKTLNPNAFRHDLDYPHYRMQAMTYDLYCKEKYGLEKDALLVFFDRAGQNTYQTEEVPTNEGLIREKMDELDAVRDDASLGGPLPPRLPKVLKHRSYDKQIVLEPPWECGYCDYSDACNPDVSKSVWAERKSTAHPWTPKDAANREMLEQHCNELLEELL